MGMDFKIQALKNGGNDVFHAGLEIIHVIKGKPTEELLKITAPKSGVSYKVGESI